ncbi:unnamed protein product, partial [Timema podura]|nr:unnamed protein product [Timema podura]
QVVNKPLPWNGGLVAVNSFGFGGANAHILLRSNPKPKAPAIQDNIPRVVAVSARTEEGVQHFLEKIESVPRDDDYISLLHEIHSSNIPGHSYRGYTVLGANTPSREIGQISGEKRPVWFVFSGMGTQWGGMGKDLMQLEVFEKAFRKCAEALKPEGFDLFDIAVNGTDATFDNVLNSFVSITAIQVGLVDVLSSIGIHPDGIVGHSVGELGCAYADGTFSAEQAVLAGYWRGRCILESKLPLGSMAAIGLSWDELKARCPPEIIPACHNSADSVTVSGPPDHLSKFVKLLQTEGIFAKEVNSSGVAFHSRYIAEAGPKLRKCLERVIPSPKQRSSRWISSSIPESAWNTALAQNSSAAYHVNNLLSPVLFKEALAHVPENAVVIELAPHCLLQAILKRSLGPTCTNVGLVKRLHPNNLEFLFSALGRLYNAGLQPKFNRLHQKVNYPVARGTPMIAPLIEWDHSTEWSVATFADIGSQRSGECIVEVDLGKEEDQYLTGHNIDGRVLFPATGYLTLVWKTLAKLKGKSHEELPVVLENVQFHRATIMPKEGTIKFAINILDGSGEFELCESGSVTVSGRIYVPEDVEKETLELPTPTIPISDSKLLKLSTADIYKDLRLRGYDYSGVFRGILESDNKGVCGELAWENNWISFMDTMLQFSILGQSTRELYLPTRLQRVVINPSKQKQLGENEGVPVHMYRDIGIIKAGGVELRGMKASLAPRRQQAQAAPKLEKYAFVPYDRAGKTQSSTLDSNGREREQALTVSLQVVLENSGGALKLKVAELAGIRPADSLLAPDVVSILESEPIIHVEITVAGSRAEEYAKVESFTNLGMKFVNRDASSAPLDQNLHLVIGVDVLPQAIEVLDNLVASLKPGGFVLLEERITEEEDAIHKSGLELVSKQQARDRVFLLLRKSVECKCYIACVVPSLWSASVILPVLFPFSGVQVLYCLCCSQSVECKCYIACVVPMECKCYIACVVPSQWSASVILPVLFPVSGVQVLYCLCCSQSVECKCYIACVVPSQWSASVILPVLFPVSGVQVLYCLCCSQSVECKCYIACVVPSQWSASVILPVLFPVSGVQVLYCLCCSQSVECKCYIACVVPSQWSASVILPVLFPVSGVQVLYCLCCSQSVECKCYIACVVPSQWSASVILPVLFPVSGVQVLYCLCCSQSVECKCYIACVVPSQWSASVILPVLFPVSGVQVLYCLCCSQSVECKCYIACVVPSQWSASVILPVLFPVSGVQVLYYLCCSQSVECKCCIACVVPSQWCASVISPVVFPVSGVQVLYRLWCSQSVECKCYIACGIPSLWSAGVILLVLLSQWSASVILPVVFSVCGVQVLYCLCCSQSVECGCYIACVVPSHQWSAGVILPVLFPVSGVQVLYCLCCSQSVECNKPVVVEVTEKNYSWVERLKLTLKQSESEGQKVLVLAQGENMSGIVGLVNCIKQEPGGSNVRCVFLQDPKTPKFSISDSLYATQLKKDLVMNVYRNGVWGSYRHIRLDDHHDSALLQVEHAYINAMTRGDLASLRWIEGPLSFYCPEQNPNKELCHVYYSPLNFRDVMLASGKLPPDALPGDLAGQDCILGLEFAGRDTSGRRVMGMVPARGLATTILVDPTFLWEVPDKWTLEQASTIPVVYATSYYALVVRGQMRAGNTLLVHAGTGGVGQASIAVALHMGVTVFTTVSSQEKRDYLKKRFPQLTDRNIANSRDTTFEQHVLTETQGRGVDLVLNSLSEDKLQASVRCLAKDGHFLEIGKYDLSNNNPLEDDQSFLIVSLTKHSNQRREPTRSGPSRLWEVTDLVLNQLPGGHNRLWEVTDLVLNQLPGGLIQFDLG